jgi:hypothetical protein
MKKTKKKLVFSFFINVFRMAFRVPYILLDESQKTQIKTNLCLKEKTTQFWGQRRGQISKGKEINFYSVDHNPSNSPTEGPDILLPMYYAGEIFGNPIPNRRIVYSTTSPFQLNLTLRDYQEEVVNLSIQNFMRCGTAFPNVFCSYGKTIVAAFFSAMFSQKYGIATLVTFPRLTIGDSWIDAFRNHTTAKVYIIGDEPNPPDPDVQVFLCMATRLTTITPEIRQRIGHFVIDEADCYCTAGSVEGLLSVEPKFITCLTATYERDDGMEKMLDLMVGPERITRISKKPFFVFHIPTGFTVPEPKVGPRGVVFDNIVETLDATPERNALIVKLVLANLNEKILIMTKHVPHVNNLHQWLSYYLYPYGKTVSKYCGTMKQYDDADITVGTIQKVGRGFDQKGGCRNWDGRRFNVAILASSTKKIEQPAGRPLRSDYPVIFDLVDNQRNCKSHWNIRRKWYESRNGQLYTVKEGLSWAEHRDRLLNEYFQNLTENPIQSLPASSHVEKIEQPKVSLSKQHAASILSQMIKK